MKVYSIAVCTAIISFTIVHASESASVKLARTFFEKKEYYHSITETLRYESQYPGGKYLDHALYLRGMSYLQGGNAGGAADAFTLCLQMRGDGMWKQKSLIARGYGKIVSNKASDAYKDFSDYSAVFKNGLYRETAALYMCYAAVLKDGDWQKNISGYKHTYPSAQSRARIAGLEKLIHEEINRPKKNAVFSVLCSIFIPGFGYFYTGRIPLGLISLGSNLIMIAGIVLSAIQGNIFSLVIFSLAEVTLYQYQLFGAQSSVDRYNSPETLHRRVRFEMSFPLEIFP